MKCPCCKGKGGVTEAVLDYGQGPYYPCDYCKDETKVGLWRWFFWMLECEWKWSGKVLEVYFDIYFKWKDRNKP